MLIEASILDEKLVLDALCKLKSGDFSARLPSDWTGVPGKIADAFNDCAETSASIAKSIDTLGHAVGKQGKVTQRAGTERVGGAWSAMLGAINTLVDDLVQPTSEVTRVIDAVARGDLSQSMTLDIDGRPIEGQHLVTAKAVNAMVRQLDAFVVELSHLAHEVGSEGTLGRQARVSGAAGAWKDLCESVNRMVGNLTVQLRDVSKVATAISKGDLSQTITVDARGEILELKTTINAMVDQLTGFAAEVTGVAREVGVEGKLGGQANVPGASGTWNYITENVNLLAANLTTQVRAIAEVATAVTSGDLTRSIRVDAKGEVAALKDNINDMIRKLKETTNKNTEQDWLKTNLAEFGRTLQGQRDMVGVCKLVLTKLSPLVNAHHGVFYTLDTVLKPAQLLLRATYGFTERKGLAKQFGLGEGLVGECAIEKERILLTEVPSDYVQINSALGHATPLNIVVLPIIFEGTVKGVMELASFNRFTPTHLAFLEQLTESLGIFLNTIEANSLTESLLQQSQSMSKELQMQQEELQKTNAGLEGKASILAAQNEQVERKNREVEAKNREVEIARKSLEAKAAQLTLTSKYKSEFLANMSHELRTPLNSLLLLAQQLADNSQGNLTSKQTEYATTIFASGNDLLNLINEILDLAKIESGTVTADASDLALADLRTFVEHTFRHVAQNKKIEFNVELGDGLPGTIFTDERRLKQIIKNLLSNAFKFTPSGRVDFKVALAKSGWAQQQGTRSGARAVLAFTIADTGIGIDDNLHKAIFEAFQQADGGTSRKYGGTGLGLAISRELARLLGGEITLESEPGKGSTFTLFLPAQYTHRAAQDVQDVSEPEALTFAQALAISETANRTRSTNGWTAPALRTAAGPALAILEPPAARVTPGATESPFADEPDVLAAVDLARLMEQLPDDRSEIHSGDRVILIVDDERYFAQTLLELAHEAGYKGLIALDGEAALRLAREHRPTAITLDVHLPDVSGWAVLDQLKNDPATRHIPVYIITVDDDSGFGAKLGAAAFLRKTPDRHALAHTFTMIEEFLTRRVRKILVAESDSAEFEGIRDLIAGSDVQVTGTSNGLEAIAILKDHAFDCIVIDLDLSDMSGFQLIDAIKRDQSLRTLPIVLYSRGELTQEQKATLEQAATSAVVKSVSSLDRLLDEVTLFLHQPEAGLSEAKQRIIAELRESDVFFAGKTVLIVDDDVRNIYALTSVLEQHNMVVLEAESGADAIDVLQRTPSIDLVLMDVMMPDMDGFQTMEAIRRLPEFKNLPMISLTAKAMKGDREKCIRSGASDYISKPVNVAYLLSLMRIWLPR